MASDNLDTVREVYARVLAGGRMEDPATSEILPELFDPEIHVRQMSSLAGTAGDFHGYGGLAESGRETVRPFAELEFVPEEIQAVGDRVATVARVRGLDG
jgi:ketosteroid isomerase-like protein